MKLESFLSFLPTIKSNKGLSLIDDEVIKSLNYYRLTQVDFDGQSETFKVISSECHVDNETNNISANASTLGGYVELQSIIGEGKFYDINIIYASGKIVYTGQHFSSEDVMKDRIYLSSTAKGFTWLI